MQNGIWQQFSEICCDVYTTVMTDFEIFIQKPNVECRTPTLKNGRIKVDRYIVCFGFQTRTYAIVLMQASPALVVRQVKFYKTILFL